MVLEIRTHPINASGGSQRKPRDHPEEILWVAQRMTVRRKL